MSNLGEEINVTGDVDTVTAGTNLNNSGTPADPVLNVDAGISLTSISGNAGGTTITWTSTGATFSASTSDVIGVNMANGLDLQVSDNLSNPFAATKFWGSYELGSVNHWSILYSESASSNNASAIIDIQADTSGGSLADFKTQSSGGDSNILRFTDDGEGAVTARLDCEGTLDIDAVTTLTMNCVGAATIGATTTMEVDGDVIKIIADSGNKITVDDTTDRVLLQASSLTGDIRLDSGNDIELVATTGISISNATSGNILISNTGSGNATLLGNTAATLEATNGDATIIAQNGNDVILDCDATAEAKLVVQTASMNSGSPSDLAVASKKYVDDTVAIPTFTAPPIFPEYAVASLPSASTYDNGVIIISDEAGGRTLATSDGTNWRRVSDGAIAS